MLLSFHTLVVPCLSPHGRARHGGCVLCAMIIRVVVVVQMAAAPQISIAGVTDYHHTAASTEYAAL